MPWHRFFVSELQHITAGNHCMKKMVLTVLDILLPVLLYFFVILINLSTWKSLLLIFFMVLVYNLLRKKFYGYYAFDHPEPDENNSSTSK
jgi:hypothetical protein